MRKLRLAFFNVFLSGLFLFSDFCLSDENTKKALKLKQQLIDYPYLISIESDHDELNKEYFQKKHYLKDYFLYELTVKSAGTSTVFTRIGFFSSRVNAQKILEKLDADSGIKSIAKIIQVPNRESRYLSSWLGLNAKRTPKNNNTISNTRLLALMEEARLAMVKNDYHSAIENYSKVAGYESTDFFQAALEYLGLARERNRQFHLARADYERYLRLYPKGVASDRVRQRLTGLVSAVMSPRDKLRKAKRSRFSNKWQTYGSFSQYYRRDTRFDESLNDESIISSAHSGFFYSARKKNRIFDIKNKVMLSHNFDFQSEEDNDLLKISTLYSEIDFRRQKLSTRIGRQMQNTSGVFSRFDGTTLAYQHRSNTSFRFVSGYPVDYDTYGEIQSNKRFYSFNLEIEKLWRLIDFNSYYINQYVDGILDRQALGFDFRHFSKQKSLFSTVDYDFHFKTINQLIVNVSYKPVLNNTLAVHFTHRKSPILTASSALQGQQVDTMKLLSQQYTNRELYQLAKDRTAEYNALTLSWRQQIKKNFALNHDYTLSELGSTPASGNVMALPGTGLEHYISSQIIMNGWRSKQDVLIAGLRLANITNSNRLTLNILHSDFVTRKTRLSSKLRVDYQSRDDDSNIYTARPGMAVNYRFSKRVRFEAELSLEHKIRKQSLDPSNESNIFFSLGYFARF